MRRYEVSWQFQGSTQSDCHSFRAESEADRFYMSLSERGGLNWVRMVEVQRTEIRRWDAVGPW